MKYRKARRLAGTILLAISLAAGNAFAAIPAEAGRSPAMDNEVVFLLDTSGSMNTQDKNRLAIDAILQAVFSLPSNYKVGFVAYNTGIQAVVPLGTETGRMEEQLATVGYSGYTNAGEGLNEALSLFSDESNGNRYVIMLSDGEIDMPDGKSREDSRILYTQAANLAKERGIKICIIAVGNELNDPQLHIFDGAELTDGAIYWEGPSGSLSQIMNRVLTDRMGLSRQLLGVTDANGGTVYAKLPKGVNRARLLITGNEALELIAADYTAESGRTVDGQKFVAVEINRPTAESVEIQFSTQDIASVQACLLTEFTLRPAVSAEYRIEAIPQSEDELKKGIPPEYEHFADVSIELVDTGGRREPLFVEDMYDGTEIPYLLNGVSYSGALDRGKITQVLPADDIDTVEVSVDVRALGGVVFVEQPVTVEIEKTPDPIFEPPPDYRPLWLIMGILAAAIAGMGIWWMKKSRPAVIYVAQQPSFGEPKKKLETKACSYSGKFNMYVVRTLDGRDIPPQTYRLFGRSGGRITLNQVLSSCQLKFGNAYGNPAEPPE